LKWYLNEGGLISQNENQQMDANLSFLGQDSLNDVDGVARDVV
jgi:hypothetical protein